MNNNEFLTPKTKEKSTMTQCTFDKHGHEVYGVKPKMFSGEWWPYFFEYYKIHLAVAIFVIFAGIITIHQIKNNVKYDCTIIYDGSLYSDDDTTIDNLEKELSDKIDDATGNDINDVFFQTMQITPTSDKIDEYTIAIQQKFTIELSEGESYLYILSKEKFEALSSSNDDPSTFLFMPCSKWLDVDIPEDQLITSNGIAYGVAADNSKVLQKYGINTTDKVILLKVIYDRNSKNEKHVVYHSNAEKIANYLLK